MKLLPIVLVAMVASPCQALERSLTQSPQGHQIHNRQVFSPDGRFIYYDSRNDDTQLATSTAIGRVEIATGKEEILYRVAKPTTSGPGVGAVACHPITGRLVFIHGLANASAAHPYAAYRRCGMSLTPDGNPVHLDARDVTPPFTPGALSGGTHAFHWSADGTLISFTYNDALIPLRPAPDDLRTIGIMIPGRRVTVTDPTPDIEFSGDAFATLVAPVTATPKPGSDEISRAFDEGWLDATRLAFQGTVQTVDGMPITELFLATLPSEPAAAQPQANSPPLPPLGITIRRLTHTAGRKFPGIQGPRHWARPAPDHSVIAFLAKDEQGIVQIFAVTADGGDLQQLSRLAQSVESPFDWSPDSKFIACSAGGCIQLIEAATGTAKTLTATRPPGQEPRYAVTFSPDGHHIAFNRLLPHPNGGDFLQIQILDLH
jgi:hypothetical protein